MIAWGILWFLALCSIIILGAMEIVNGSIEKRFWICVILAMFIIIVPCFTIQEFKQSINFYNDYCQFYNKVTSQELTENQQYSILGKVMNYNHWLFIYQNKFHRWGIFAPTYRKIKDLQPIQLDNFDMTKYRFWEW